MQAQQRSIRRMEMPAPVGRSLRFMAEMIGRARRIITTRLFPTVTVDATKTDYAFWDQLRHGKKADYALGALFAKPITRILASWVLGKGFDVKIENAESTQSALSSFIKQYLKLIIGVVRDMFALGDSYIAVNPDGSLEWLSPDQVEAICYPKGSKNVVGYQVTTVLDGLTIIDELYANKRVRTEQKGETKTTVTYPNLTGRIPIIHFANERGANELYGRPIYEALLKLFLRYDRALNKGLDGVELMGNPIPVISGNDDPDQTLEEMADGDETPVYDSQQNAKNRPTVSLATDEIMFLGPDQKFYMVTPPTGFTTDAGKMLEYLFLLMLQHIGIPEWVWGGAIASSKASVDAQMPAFALLIDGIRLELVEPLTELLRVWLATVSLFTPGIDAEADFDLSFPSITADDRKQKLDEVKFAREDGQLSREDAATVLNLTENPAEAVNRAREEREADQAASVDQTEQAINAALLDLANKGQNEDADTGKTGKKKRKPKTDVSNTKAA